MSEIKSIAGIAFLLLLLAIAPVTGADRTRNSTQPSGSADVVKVLSANVGNVDPVCASTVKSKLCYASVETTIKNRIASEDPDVVFL